LRRGLCLHEFAPERAIGRTPVSIKDRQRKRERKKNAGQPGRELHEHIGSLRAENIVCDCAAKCRTQAFALWPLHQDHQHHHQRHEHEERQTEIDQQIHRDAEYRRLMTNDK